MIIITDHMKVSPVLASPLVFNVSTISDIGIFSCICILNTVENTVTPDTKLRGRYYNMEYGVWSMGYLTILLKNGVNIPNRTAPCDRFMNVAYVRNNPTPAPNQ